MQLGEVGVKLGGEQIEVCICNEFSKSGGCWKVVKGCIKGEYGGDKGSVLGKIWKG